jgi:hypothetical protein
MTKNTASLTSHVGFRVKESIFRDIQSRAQAEGISPNDWCRKRLLQTVDLPLPTPAHYAILAEIVATQDIVAGLFCALGRDGRLTPQKAKEIVDAAHERKYREVAALFRYAESRAEIRRTSR